MSNAILLHNCGIGTCHYFKESEITTMFHNTKYYRKQIKNHWENVVRLTHFLNTRPLFSQTETLPTAGTVGNYYASNF